MKMFMISFNTNVLLIASVLEIKMYIGGDNLPETWHWLNSLLSYLQMQLQV